MQRDLQRLASDSFDVLVVGGGIHGLATAWDAALRGLSVALVEKSDFGSETSANSLKTIHGGLRYLQHLDVRRMHESIRERSAWMRLMPHLVKPLPFLVPTYGYGMKSKGVMATAVRVNDWISRYRNEGLEEVGLEIPNCRVLNRSECLDLAPWLKAPSLTGGVQFFDGQLFSADRATMAFAHAASERDALLVNHVEVVRLLRDGSRCTGAVVTDQHSGEEITVSARVVVNAAGPWNSLVHRLLEPAQPRPTVRLSKGIQLVMRGFTPESAVAVTSTYEDPDAVVSRGGRHYFLAPWRGTTLCGTTDELFEGDPDDFDITKADADGFFEELKQALPDAGLVRDAVLYTFGGLRPLEEKNVHTGSQTARHSRVIDHRSTTGVEGLVELVGVKYTTARLVAERAVDVVSDMLGSGSVACETSHTPLWGGATGPIRAFLDRTAAGLSDRLGPDGARNLAQSYGTGSEKLRPLLLEDDATLGLPGREEVVQAQVRFAVREESAIHLDDVIRRIDLRAFGDPGDPAIDVCLDVLRDECDWDDTRCEAERKRLPVFVR